MQLDDIMRSRVFRAVAGTSGLRAGMIVLTLATSVLLARVLGPTGYGLYVFALSFVTLAGLPVQLGVPVIVLRETAKANASGDWGTMRGVWFWAGRRIVISALIVVPLVAIAAWFGHEHLVPDGALPVLFVALALVPMIAGAQIRGSALRGLDRPILGQLPETLVRPSGLLVLVAGLSVLLPSVSPGAAMAAYVAASALAFGLGTWLLMRATPGGLRAARPRITEAPAWRKAIVPLALISGMQILMQNVGLLLLGIWHEPDEIGLFRIAMAAATMVMFGLSVANQIVAPRFASLHAKGDTDGMARHARLSAGMALLAATPIALILMLFGRDVLGFLYGDAFRPAYDALVWLVAAQVVNAFFGSCISLLNMSGHERDTARALVVAATTNAGLSVLLIPLMGAVGAALATLGSTVLWNVLMERDVRRHLGFTSTPLALLQKGFRGAGQ